jgi:hypothetical protein
MKAKKFGLFASIKYIDNNIDVYRKIADVVRGQGIAMYKPEFVDNYPESKKKAAGRNDSIVEGTQKQIRAIDFAIAYFSDKSRTVFFQTILALENKIPVLCLVSEDSYKDFPETLLSYGEDFIKVRKYKGIIEIDEIILDYIDELDPPKRRFNVVLKTNTLKQMEQLCANQEISKAELMRRIVDKEYRRIFGGK